MKLSVITINFNNKAGLIATAMSMFRQTCYDFEYIVIDGGSSDGSKEFLEENSSKIDYWVSEPDSGIYNAMNKGVTHASGEYCLFLNSGDTMHDEHVIEHLLPSLDSTDFVIGRILFTETGEESLSNYPLSMKWFYSGSIPHPATCIKRPWLERFPYDESLKIVSDWKFFLQCIVLNNASYKMANVVVADFEAGGISGNNTDLVAKEREETLSQLLPQRILIDYYHFQNGQGYENSTYDNFYLNLRKYNYHKAIYSINIIILRLLAIVKHSARFVYSFPRRIK